MRLPPLALLGVALVGLVASPPSRTFAEPPASTPAADAAAEIKALIAEIDAGLKEKDDTRVTAAVKKAPGLYKSTQDQAVRGPLLKALGGLVKQVKLASARRAALTAIVDTEDGKEGYKALQGAYPKNDVEDAERFNVEIVKAIGALHPDAAIDALVETFRKAEQHDLSAEAVTALGNYHKSKQRERILEDIYKAGKIMIPSQSSSKQASPESRARWGVLGPAIGKALDTLTGDTVGDATEWFKKIGDAKVVKSLFKD